MGGITHEDGSVFITGKMILDTLLVRLSPKDWTREVMVGERKLTLAARLFGLYVHDTYHTGQTEVLRQQIEIPMIY